MKMPKILVVVVFLLLMAANTVAGQSIVGSWRLISYEDVDEKGVVVRPWGEHPLGILIYDDSGHMAVQIQRMPLAKGTAKNALTPNKHDKLAFFDSYIAYFGTYKVDTIKMTVTHFVEGNFFASLVGTSSEKAFEITGDRFLLKPVWVENGHKITGTRVFERMK